jgi:hypothetical protein
VCVYTPSVMLVFMGALVLCASTPSVMLVFMGALVLCASTPSTPLWMPLHYCACTPIFTDSPRQAMMASPSK